MSLLVACSAVQATALVPAASPTVTTSKLTVEVPSSLLSATTSPTEEPVPFTPTFTPEVISPAPTLSHSSNVSFSSIRMIDIQKGWTIADLGVQRRSHILHTTDGGATWE